MHPTHGTADFKIDNKNVAKTHAPYQLLSDYYKGRVKKK